MAEQQYDASEDAMTTRIGQAVMLHRAGDREEARQRFALLWTEASAGGDHFQRCTIAHYMADTQDDPALELEWDRRALAAADALGGSEVQWGEHALAVRALYPSLYLNLAMDHERLGQQGPAREHVVRARKTVGALSDDDYGAGIRAAIERLEERLGVA